MLGIFHLHFEIRQFAYNPRKYARDIWNFFDVGAYSLPIITSIIWLINEEPPPNQLISLSNLLLDLKFMLFLRVFKYFGAYFTIILGVAKNVFSFLVILFIIILSFSHAFYIILRPSQYFTIDEPTVNDDPNNPWNLVDKYFTYFTNNNSYNQDSYALQPPDNKTNMFALFSTSMLAMYNFLAGDNSAFGPWPLQNDPYLAILVVIFSFIVVVYLMNLFIGLLSNEIEIYNKREAFLAQKAKMIVEIELFYLFPEHRLIEIDGSNEDPKPFISDELRNIVEVAKPEKQINIENKFERLENDIKVIKDQLESNKMEIKNELKGIENLIKALLNEEKKKSMIKRI
ncbi:9939_t:CDS:2 [Entrophospora sp. SA101]|nr:9939_t:CDS:2 [Entrophospora sp. SA101]